MTDPGPGPHVNQVAIDPDDTAPGPDAPHWFHLWIGMRPSGKHVRVVLGPLPWPPDDTRIKDEQFPARRDSQPGPQCMYLASFHHRPTWDELEQVDPAGSQYH